MNYLSPIGKIHDLLPEFAYDHPGAAITGAVAFLALLISAASLFLTVKRDRHQRSWEAQQEARRQQEREEDRAEAERRLAPQLLITFEVTRIERQGFREYYLSVFATNTGQPNVMVVGRPTIRVDETDLEIDLSKELWDFPQGETSDVRTLSTSRFYVSMIRCAVIAMHAQSQNVRGLVPIHAEIKTSHGATFRTETAYPFSFNDDWPREPYLAWGMM